MQLLAGSPPNLMEGVVQPDPAGRVSAPAIGLMAAGGLSALVTLFAIAMFAISGTAAVSDPELRDALPGVGIVIVLLLVKLVMDVVTIFAGWQMRQLKSWSICMAGSILAMLPCSLCCILGLPMGIWALIVLVDTDVKQAFYGGVPPDGYDPGGYGPPPGGYGP